MRRIWIYKHTVDGKVKKCERLPLCKESIAFGKLSWHGGLSDVTEGIDTDKHSFSKIKS